MTGAGSRVSQFLTISAPFARNLGCLPGFTRCNLRICVKELDMFPKRIILVASVLAILASSVETGTAAAPQVGSKTMAQTAAKKKPKKFNVRYAVVRRHPAWGYRLFPNKAMAQTFAAQMRRANFRTHTQRM